MFPIIIVYLYSFARSDQPQPGSFADPDPCQKRIQTRRLSEADPGSKSYQSESRIQNRIVWKLRFEI